MQNKFNSIMIIIALIFCTWSLELNLYEYFYPCELDKSQTCTYYQIYYYEDVRHLGFDFDYRYKGEVELLYETLPGLNKTRHLVDLPEKTIKRNIARGSDFGGCKNA